MDTNLLLLYSVGRYDPNLIPRFTTRLSRYDVEDYQLLRQFIGLFRKVITTPHVLTETINLIDKKSGRYSPVLSRLASEVAIFDERYVSAADIIAKNGHYLSTFGLTDLVLCELAQQSVVILTDDGAVGSLITGKKGLVLNFGQLRDLLIQKKPPGRRR